MSRSRIFRFPASGTIPFISRFFFMTRSLISQTYTGDITIVPAIGYSEYLKLMTNPVAPEVRVNIRKAEHATWERTRPPAGAPAQRRV